ncbi:serine/threonine protein kinase [Mangrovimicrobium sediminis]|uniref:Serine/threonine protein kinase n=1 Tax=Mangrovimicrobium sediminis TaxID=2562682 RepID=A0A4Z0LZN4_9GAMM|nr:serine/threonine-protein kinase [Haliea sp. SAOS-164]TGD72731.1 serine/threonine protein kinase [Haliea sp. SAOS-164]
MEFPTIPGYTILKRLGHGGMADIFLAEQTSFGRQVALKVMSPHLLRDPSFGDRFLREARIVAQLTHPNFVPVYEVGRHEDFHYLSMEYLPGGSLKELLQRGIALAEGFRIARELASALDYAARRKFVHRDVKPENILLREDRSAVICDFGIAKQTDGETQMTQAGVIVGTPSYMSPEQAMARNPDGRSDLYSLGIIFYEMMVGEVPFAGDSPVSTGIMHINNPIPRLPEQLAGFQAFIDRALAKDPDNRFQTGREFLDALEELEVDNAELVHINPPAAVVSAGAARRSGRGSTTGRTGGSGSRNLSSHLDTQTAVLQPRRPRRLTTWITAATTVAMGATGWWLWQANQSPPLPSRSAATSTSTHDVATWTADLLRRARQAMDQGRLYGNDGQNAQAYLTSLLELAPDDSGGRVAINRLFGLYLEGTGEALEQQDFRRARELLQQASLINFYVSDEELVQHKLVLQEALAANQQQQQITEQRDDRTSRLLDEAGRLLAAGQLTSPLDANAYVRYQDVLALDPQNAAAQQGIVTIAGLLLEQARAQADAGELGRADALIRAALQVYPQHPDLAATSDSVRMEKEALLQRLDEETRKLSARQEAQREALQAERSARQERVQALLAGAEKDLAAGRLDAPTGENAVEKFREVRELDPANLDALTGIEKVAGRFIDAALADLKSGELDVAETKLQRARSLSPANARYAQVQIALIEARDRLQQQAAADSQRTQRVAALLRGAQQAAQRGNLYLPRGDNALESLQQVLELDPGNAEALALRASLLEQVAADTQLSLEKKAYGEAQQAIAALEAGGAPAARVQALKNTLAAATAPARPTAEVPTVPAVREQRKAQADEILASADALTATPYTRPGLFGNNRQALATLRSAAQKIDEARTITGETPALARSRAKLVEKYGKIIALHVDDGNAEAAREFLDDLAASGLGADALARWSDQVASLEQRAGRKGMSISSF